MINLEKIRDTIRKIYEKSSDIKILQEELDNMLGTIDKNNLDYNNGKISKEIYESDYKKLKKESIGIIKKINKNIKSNLDFIKIIKEEIVPKKKRKKGS